MNFLDSLASKKRKNIKRERKGALESGVVIERLSGKEILEYHWDAFYRFYLDTANRKMGFCLLTGVFLANRGIHARKNFVDNVKGWSLCSRSD